MKLYLLMNIVIVNHHIMIQFIIVLLCAFLTGTQCAFNFWFCCDDNTAPARNLRRRKSSESDLKPLSSSLTKQNFKLHRTAPAVNTNSDAKATGRYVSSSDNVFNKARTGRSFGPSKWTNTGEPAQKRVSFNTVETSTSPMETSAKFRKIPVGYSSV